MKIRLEIFNCLQNPARFFLKKASGRLNPNACPHFLRKEINLLVSNNKIPQTPIQKQNNLKRMKNYE